MENINEQTIVAEAGEESVKEKKTIGQKVGAGIDAFIGGTKKVVSKAAKSKTVRKVVIGGAALTAGALYVKSKLDDAKTEPESAPEMISAPSEPETPTWYEVPAQDVFVSECTTEPSVEVETSETTVEL